MNEVVHRLADKERIRVPRPEELVAVRRWAVGRSDLVGHAEVIEAGDVCG